MEELGRLVEDLEVGERAGPGRTEGGREGSWELVAKEEKREGS